MCSSKYFAKSKQLQDIDRCSDLTSLQALLFKNMFVLAICRGHICYTHITMSLTIALRMGLHRSVQVNQDLVAFEIGKRIFWALRMLLNEISANCGLPKLLDDRDIDQRLPTEVNDAYIRKTQILPQPHDEVCHMAGGNSYRRLHQIRDQAAQTLYPATSLSARKYSYNATIEVIHTVERELEDWYRALPLGYRLGTSFHDSKLMK